VARKGFRGISHIRKPEGLSVDDAWSPVVVSEFEQNRSECFGVIGIGSRHHHVQNDHGVTSAFESCERNMAVIDGFDLRVGSLEQRGEQASDRRVVVNDQNHFRLSTFENFLWPQARPSSCPELPGALGEWEMAALVCGVEAPGCSGRSAKNSDATTGRATGERRDKDGVRHDVLARCRRACLSDAQM
jgi:hypothetical protein